jgi:hypothetical protein
MPVPGLLAAGRSMRMLMRMATRNVYVSDSDLPLFERGRRHVGGRGGRPVPVRRAAGEGKEAD